MIFSGYKQRSISDQTGNLEFNWTMSLSNQTGVCNVGLSGAKVFQFQLKSGKVYDTSGNFVQSYSNNVAFNVSGQLSPSTYDYSIDNELIAMGNPIPTGKLSWLFVNPVGVNIDFNGYIKGSAPDYSLTSGDAYLYENYTVTGRIVNNNPQIAFRIFDAYLGQQSGVGPYTLSSFTTGDIYNTGYITFTSDQIGLSDYLVPVTLDTNFGQVNYNFLISGDYGEVPDVYLNISPDTVNIQNGTSKNYLAQFSNHPSGAALGISLEYLSGITGNIYFYTGVTRAYTGTITGAITGQGYLTRTETNIVSGLDPQTSIYETGFGTGTLTSNLMIATGAVTGTYSIPVYGLGQGDLEIDFTVSGEVSGGYSGTIPLSGGYLNLVAYNFLGTGNDPAFGTGIAEAGTGVIRVNPTGCFTLASGLNYGVGYYSGNLSADKVYEGQIVIPYSILSVGYATGDFLSGTVRSDFNRNFEQASYHFTKYFSGIALGKFAFTGTFNPIVGIIESDTTGIITGIFNSSLYLNCDSSSSFNSFAVSGLPALVYNSTGGLVSGASAFLTTPSGGFGSGETLAHSLSGNYTRTKISRMGETISGTGIFQNIVGVPADVSLQAGSGVQYQKLWKETMLTSGGSGTFDSIDNGFHKISTEVYITGTGTYNTGSGFIIAEDYSMTRFYISGSGAKTMAIRGLNPNPNNIVEFYLLKNSWPTEIWGANGVLNYQSGYSYAFDRHRDEVMDGVDPDDDTVVVLQNLTSGVYDLYVVESERDLITYPYPTVYFKQSLFTGCESNGHLLIEVCAAGNITEPIWWEMDTYTEITAHSGVNYDPVYIRYLEGESAITGMEKSHFGGVFGPNYGTEEVCQTFTIPIYNNANYGGPHEFRMTLTNPLRCNLGSQYFATGSILDDDVTILSVATGFGYLTGVSGFVTGISGLYAPQPQCTPVAYVAPPYSPYRRPTQLYLPSEKDPCEPTTSNCCSCDNLVSGSGQLGAGLYLPAGAKCGIIEIDTASACFDSDSIYCVAAGAAPWAWVAREDAGWFYAGKVCSARGSHFEYDYDLKGDSNGTLEVMVVDKSCIGTDGLCPDDPNYVDIDTVLSDAGINPGNAPAPVSVSMITGCKNLSKKEIKNKKAAIPIGDPCTESYVFLKINNLFTYDSPSFVGAWGFTGWTQTNNNYYPKSGLLEPFAVKSALGARPTYAKRVTFLAPSLAFPTGGWYTYLALVKAPGSP